jgi:hypothetical protein
MSTGAEGDREGGMKAEWMDEWVGEWRTESWVGGWMDGRIRSVDFLSPQDPAQDLMVASTTLSTYLFFSGNDC